MGAWAMGYGAGFPLTDRIVMSAETLSPADAAPRILLVEDDPEISALVARFLRNEGYVVAAVGNGRAMDAAMAEQKFDVALLDLMLPQESGFDLCRRLRATSDLRIIMVTALAEVRDRVAGLDQGADDYLSKPFELVELGARIRAVLRRGIVSDAPGRSASGTKGLSFAGWRFEPERRALYTPKGVRMALTGAETDLMLVFLGHARQVLSRSQLIELTRGAEGIVEERTIDLLISRLRRKLAQGGRQLELIRTVRGDGYVFDPDAGMERS
jgi:two-component system, OmpR family, response regulator